MTREIKEPRDLNTGDTLTLPDFERCFPNSIGNIKLKERINKMIQSDRLAHAFLIHGPEGSGVFALALDMALLLHCRGSEKTCLECEPCRKIMNYAYPQFQVYHPFPSIESLKVKEEEYWSRYREKTKELIEDPHMNLWFEKEANLSIPIISQMQRNISGGAEEGWRVIVLHEADRMKEEAANKILKTLEEPPDQTIFLICTSRPFMLLPTIISRCQKLRLGPVSDDELTRFLREKAADAGAAEIETAVSISEGSIARAREALEGELDEARTMAENWIRTTETGNLRDALATADEMSAVKDHGLIRKTLEIVLIMIRDACILSDQKESFSIRPARADRHRQEIKRILSGIEGNCILKLLLFTSIRNLQNVASE